MSARGREGEKRISKGENTRLKGGEFKERSLQRKTNNAKVIVLSTKPGHLHSRTTKTGEDEEVANGMGVCAKISTVLNTSHELTMVMLTTILRVVNTTIPILRMKVVTLGAWWDSLPKVKESVIGRTRN